MYMNTHIIQQSPDAWHAAAAFRERKHDVQAAPPQFAPAEPASKSEHAPSCAWIEEYFAQKLKVIRDEIAESRTENLVIINRVNSQSQEQFRQLDKNQLEHQAELRGFRAALERLHAQVGEINGKLHQTRLHGIDSIDHKLAVQQNDAELVMGDNGRKKQQGLQVTIKSAAKLPCMDAFGGLSDLYCVVEAVGKPQSKIQTPVIRNSDAPVWDYAGELVDFAHGDALQVSVFSKNMFWWDDLLGKVVVPHSKFNPGGFSGNIEIDEFGATVHLIVTSVEEQAPAGPTRPDVTGAQTSQKSLEVLQCHADMLDQKFRKVEQKCQDTMIDVQRHWSELQSRVAKQNVACRVGGIDHQELDCRIRSLELGMIHLQNSVTACEEASQTSIANLREALSTRFVEVCASDSTNRTGVSREIQNTSGTHLPEADDEQGSCGSTLSSVGRLHSLGSLVFQTNFVKGASSLPAMRLKPQRIAHDAVMRRFEYTR